jgi:transposase
VSDITSVTGMRIIRAIMAGERVPDTLAEMRDIRCHSSIEKICAALSGNWRDEHIFALGQSLALYDFYQTKIAECDKKLEVALKALEDGNGHDTDRLPKVRTKTRQVNTPDFEVRSALYRALGVDLTQIHGIGPSLALKLVGECGTDLTAWPSAKHFTAPGNKISGGKLLSSRTRRSSSRAAALLRLAATTIGRSDTALGAFYRRLSARAGKAKAVTATARKIAVLFYNSLRHGMAYHDPGASRYEEQYRSRIIGNLQRRAKAFGFVLQEMPEEPDISVS